MWHKQWFAEKFWEFVVATVLGIIWGSVLGWLQIHKSTWAVPLLYGTAGAFAVWAAAALYIGVSRIPRLRTRVTIANIEGHVRDWLDVTGCSVKRDPGPDVYFRFIVQLPAGANVTVGRAHVTSEHIFVAAGMANEKSIPPGLEGAPKEEQEKLLEMIKLELARARVGYFGLAVPVSQQFSIVKRIRITDHLHEEDFVRTLWDVEAAVNAVRAIYALWVKESSGRGDAGTKSSQ